MMKLKVSYVMSRKITILTIALFTILISSCINQSKNYFEHRIKIQIMNIKSSAKNYCISIGLDFDQNNHIRTEMYHRCIVELVKQAKVHNPLQPYQIYYNKGLDKFIKDEVVKLDYAIENLNNYRNNYLDNIDHKECIKRGYNDSIYDSDKLESYYMCRRSLISAFLSFPKDSKLNNSSYNSSFVINKNQDRGIINTLKFNSNYPPCSKFKYFSSKGKQCKADFDNNSSCKQKNKKRSIEIRMRMNKVCQERLYSKLPDSLLIKNDKNKDKYSERNFLTDLYLNPSLYDFLKNEEIKTSFEAAKKSNANDNKQKTNEELINNKNTEIYSRQELVSLRRQFIIGCTNQIDNKIKNYIDRYDRICDSKVIKWKKTRYDKKSRRKR